jgi:hypothetical protein
MTDLTSASIPSAGYSSSQTLAENGNNSQELAPDGVTAAEAVGSSSAALQIPYGSGYTAYGDSITLAPLDSNTPVGGYVAKLAGFVGGTFINRGVGSTTILEGQRYIYQNNDLLPSRTQLVSIGYGMNDWRLRQGVVENAYFVRSIRLFLEQCFSRQYLLANNAAITYSTSPAWNVSDRTGTARSGANARQSANNAWLSFPVTDCDNCTIVLWAVSYSYISTSVRVFVDDVLWDDVNVQAQAPPGEQNGSAFPIFIRFPRGNHTIRVANNSEPNIWFDYAIIRRQASEANAPVLVFSTTNATDSQRAGVTQAQWDALNERVRKAVQQYQHQGYPVRWVDLNVEYDPTPGVDTIEGVHPVQRVHNKLLLNALAEVAIV